MNTLMKYQHSQFSKKTQDKVLGRKQVKSKGFRRSMSLQNSQTQFLIISSVNRLTKYKQMNSQQSRIGLKQQLRKTQQKDSFQKQNKIKKVRNEGIHKIIQELKKISKQISYTIKLVIGIYQAVFVQWNNIFGQLKKKTQEFLTYQASKFSETLLKQIYNQQMSNQNKSKTQKVSKFNKQDEKINEKQNIICCDLKNQMEQLLNYNNGQKLPKGRSLSEKRKDKIQLNDQLQKQFKDIEEMLNFLEKIT